MVSQYPYELWAQLLSEDSTQSDKGDYVSVEPEWVSMSPCRDEANSRGGSVILEDASAYVYDSVVQLPKSCPVLSNGTQVEVRQNDAVRLRGTVRRFQADQLHSRLWV